MNRTAPEETQSPVTEILHSLETASWEQTTMTPLPPVLRCAEELTAALYHVFFTCNMTTWERTQCLSSLLSSDDFSQVQEILINITITRGSIFVTENI